MRKIKFEIDNYYHIYNRGVDKRNIFEDQEDYNNFFRRMREMNNSSSDAQRNFLKLSFGDPKLSFRKLMDMPCLVEFVAYCLNPNHFHFLVRQKQEKGIEKFMHKLGLGYTKYFNKKHKRSGALFQGTYKAVAVLKESQLLYVSAYVNMNQEIHAYSEAKKSIWSSYPDYIGLRRGTLCNKELVLENFKDIQSYVEYAETVKAKSASIKEDLRQMNAELEGRFSET
jgi:REP element-mobilizing transposase RayT